MSFLGERVIMTKNTLRKKNSVFLKCSILSASETNSKKNKLERGEAGGKEKKPDYLDILKEMQIFISFLDKVKSE